MAALMAALDLEKASTLVRLQELEQKVDLLREAVQRLSEATLVLWQKNELPIRFAEEQKKAEES
jgi:hypothetical protein